MIKKYSIAFIFLIIFFALLYVNISPAPEAEPLEFNSLRIAAVEEPASVPILLASKEGSFFQRNLRVDLNLLENKEQLQNAILAGVADGAILGLKEAALLQADGIYVKVIAVFGYNEEPISSPGDYRAIVFSGEALTEQRREINIFHHIYSGMVTELARKEYVDNGFDYSQAFLSLPRREEVTRLIKKLQHENQLPEDYVYEDLIDTE